jgi:hypothetical protein
MSMTVNIHKVLKNNLKNCFTCGRGIVKDDLILRIVTKSLCNTTTANICRKCIDRFNFIMMKGERL